VKRIYAACINQTIHFQLKEGLARSLALKEVKSDFENYKNMLARNGTKYRIVDETLKDDGSILIKVKKQVSGHDVGDYLD